MILLKLVSVGMYHVCEPIQVECYSGHTYAQEPRTIKWQGRVYRVEKILSRWREPAGPCFLVVTGEDIRLRIRYIEETDRWNLME